MKLKESNIKVDPYQEKNLEIASKLLDTKNELEEEKKVSEVWRCLAFCPNKTMSKMDFVKIVGESESLQSRVLDRIPSKGFPIQIDKDQENKYISISNKRQAKETVAG